MGFYYTICLSCLVKQTETREMEMLCMYFCMHGICDYILLLHLQTMYFGSYNYILTWLVSVTTLHVCTIREISRFSSKTNIFRVCPIVQTARKKTQTYFQAEIIFHNISIQNKKQTVLSICLGSTKQNNPFVFNEQWCVCVSLAGYTH